MEHRCAREHGDVRVRGRREEDHACCRRFGSGLLRDERLERRGDLGAAIVQRPHGQPAHHAVRGTGERARPTGLREALARERRDEMRRAHDELFLLVEDEPVRALDRPGVARSSDRPVHGERHPARRVLRGHAPHRHRTRIVGRAQASLRAAQHREVVLTEELRAPIGDERRPQFLGDRRPALDARQIARR